MKITRSSIIIIFACAVNGTKLKNRSNKYLCKEILLGGGSFVFHEETFEKFQKESPKERQMESSKEFQKGSSEEIPAEIAEVLPGGINEGYPG